MSANMKGGQGQGQGQNPYQQRAKHFGVTKREAGVVHHGVVKKWMTDRGYGYVKSSDFMVDVMVRFDAIAGGGNLVVGRPVQFELDTTTEQLRGIKVVGEGINKIWFDRDGVPIDWKVAVNREIRRIARIDEAPSHKKTEITYLDTRYLTDKRDDDTAYDNMVNGREATEARVRSKLPPGMKLDPITLKAIPDDRLVRFPVEHNKKIKMLGITVKEPGSVQNQTYSAKNNTHRVSRSRSRSRGRDRDRRDRSRSRSRDRRRRDSRGRDRPRY